MKACAARKIRTCFLLGVVISMPMIASVYIFNWILGLATGWFPRNLPFIKDLNIKPIVYEKSMQVLAIVVMFLLFCLMGWIAQHFLGKRLYRLTDLLFSRVPVVKTIYLFIRQVCEWVAKRKNSVFQEVVLVEYPRKGLYSVAFVTASLPPDSPTRVALARSKGVTVETLGEVVNLFIATTPNPTSGIYLVAPRSELIQVGMDTATAINLVMSAGAISPAATAAAAADPIGDLLKTWECAESEAREEKK